MEHHQNALIIAASSQMRDSLEVLLHSIPGIEIVCKAADLAEALDYCHVSDVALVVYEFENEPVSIQKLGALKRALPGPQIIVLVDDEYECQQVEHVGITCLPSGMHAARLAEVIERLVVPA